MDRNIAEARRYLNRLASNVRTARLNREAADLNFAGSRFGRNFAASQESARYNATKALTAIVAVEDEHGVEAAASLDDRFTRLRQEATTLGLLSAQDVSEIETEATR